MSLILLRGGKILRGKHWVRVNIVINPSTGRIVNIYKSHKVNLYLRSQIDKIIDARDNLILPGLTDLHFHFRSVRSNESETFETESAAAVAGGVTTVIDMSIDDYSINLLDKLIQVDEILKVKSFTDYGLTLGLPSDLDLLNQLNTSNLLIIGIKVRYPNGNEEKIVHSSTLPKGFLYIFHAEPRSFIKENNTCLSHEGFEGKELEKVEVEAIKNIIKFAEKGYRVHVSNVSSWQSIELIYRAKKRHTKITFDTAPHYLILSKDEMRDRERSANFYPPLRDKLNKIVLTRMFRAGLIEAISSSHAPKVHQIEKENSCTVSPGIPAVQYMLPLIFTLFKKIHVKDPRILLKMLSENPARIIGLKDKGKIKVGNYADLVIFDHRKKWKIDPDLNYSKTKETPYDGMIVRGIVKTTLVRGKLVFLDGEFISKVGKNIVKL